MKLDGFRGKFGDKWITEAYFYRLPFVLKQLVGFEKIVVAHDPRPSSFPLYEAIVKGAKDAGLSVILARMMPTPMLAKWVHDNQLCGLMVTASHNPSSDNGIKFINFELSQEDRKQASRLLESTFRPFIGCVESFGPRIKEDYLGALKQAVGGQHHNCLVDAAHGAWGDHLDVLEEVGFKVTRYDVGDEEINSSGCVNIRVEGYPEGFDYIVLFDGDGDRLQLIRNGQIFDGDDMLLHLSKDQKLMVGTVLSNQGLEDVLVKRGVQFVRTDVGDQNVHQALRDKGGRYGGEICGHIVDLEWMGYSDPVYMFGHLMSKGEMLPLQKIYQCHLNVSNEYDVDLLRSMLFHPKVRLVVRRSNTEPLIRIMLEGDQGLVLGLLNSYSLNSASISEKNES